MTPLSCVVEGDTETLSQLLVETVVAAFALVGHGD
jgi:hypothetical protein